MNKRGLGIGARTFLVVAGLLATLGRPQALAGEADSGNGVSSTTRTAIEAMLNEDPRSDEKLANDGLVEAAYATMVLHHDGIKAASYLERAFRTQITDRSNAMFGYMPVAVTGTEINDPNEVQFFGQALGPLLAGYGSELPRATVDRLKPNLDAALVAISTQKVAIGYTNIYLMKTVNLLVIGNARHDEAALHQGEAMLRAWIAYTKVNGISEYDSPAYYEPDLNSLSNGYRYAPSARDRAMLGEALNYIWTDIAANFFVPGNKLAGPYSRNYDLIRGVGGIDSWLAAEDIAPGALPPPSLRSIYLLDALRPGGYVPAARVRELSRSGAREVTSALDEQTHRYRYDWMGNAMQMGCASGEIAAQDVLFSAAFPGPIVQPQASIIVDDGAGGPYGAGFHPDAEGVSKPSHAGSGMVCVEHNGTALLTLSIDAKQLAGTAAGATVNFVLPSAAAIAVDGSTVAVDRPARIPLGAGNVVTATLGGGTLAILLKGANLTMRSASRVSLVSETAGLQHSVVRMSIVGLAPGLPTTVRQWRLEFLIRATDGDAKTAIADLKNAAFSTGFEGNVWFTRATVAGTSLDIERSGSLRSVIEATTIDGHAPPASPLAVDGRDISSRAWSNP